MQYKFTVNITQELKYTDRLIGTFDNMDEVNEFVTVVMKHFDKIKVDISVEIVTPEDEKEEGESERCGKCSHSLTRTMSLAGTTSQRGTTVTAIPLTASRFLMRTMKHRKSPTG